MSDEVKQENNVSSSTVTTPPLQPVQEKKEEEKKDDTVVKISVGVTTESNQILIQFDREVAWILLNIDEAQNLTNLVTRKIQEAVQNLVKKK
jgi:hypothetical protein